MNIVSSQLLSWVKAWENQNITLYLSFYSKDFKAQKKSRSIWENYRRRSLGHSSQISIQISNIQMHKIKNIINVTFNQKFKSNKISDNGKKELSWKKEDRKWKIIKESWSPI